MWEKSNEAHSKRFLVNFSDIDFWDVNSSYLKLTNYCEWTTYPLSQLVKIRMEEATKEEISTHSILLLDRISFDEGKVFAGKRLQTQMKQFKGYKGDIVVSKINAKKGAVGVVKGDFHIGSTIHFRTLIPNCDLIDTRFLWLALRSSYCRNQFRIATGGQGKGEISEKLLLQIEIPFPKRKIQQKIVAYWEKVQQAAETCKSAKLQLIVKLNQLLISRTDKYKLLRNSKLFSVHFSKASQWDLKAGRAAVFKEANPSFIRLGDYTVECAKMVKPWEFTNKVWPIYGVNNKSGVFLSAEQKTSDFNTAYKRIEKNWFFHNPTRANVGSLGIVPEVSEDALTSPEYQVWRLIDGFEPEFMDLMLHTEYFLTLVSFNRVGGVKQRMYYTNLAEIRLPLIENKIQQEFIEQKRILENEILKVNNELTISKKKVEMMIQGITTVEDI